MPHKNTNRKNKSTDEQEETSQPIVHVRATLFPLPILWMVLRDLAWVRLDRRYTPVTPIGRRSDQEGVAETHAIYSASAIGSFAVLSDSVQEAVLAELLDYIEFHEDVTGLEGLLITCIQSTWSAADPVLLARAVRVWEQWGRSSEFVASENIIAYNEPTRCWRILSHSAVAAIRTEAALIELISESIERGAGQIAAPYTDTWMIGRQSGPMGRGPAFAVLDQYGLGGRGPGGGSPVSDPYGQGWGRGSGNRGGRGRDRGRGRGKGRGQRGPDGGYGGFGLGQSGAYGPGDQSPYGVGWGRDGRGGLPGFGPSGRGGPVGDPLGLSWAGGRAGGRGRRRDKEFGGFSPGGGRGSFSIPGGTQFSGMGEYGRPNELGPGGWGPGRDLGWGRNQYGGQSKVGPFASAFNTSVLDKPGQVAEMDWLKHLSSGFGSAVQTLGTVTMGIGMATPMGAGAIAFGFVVHMAGATLKSAADDQIARDRNRDQKEEERKEKEEEAKKTEKKPDEPKQDEKKKEDEKKDKKDKRPPPHENYPAPDDEFPDPYGEGSGGNPRSTKFDMKPADDGVGVGPRSRDEMPNPEDDGGIGPRTRAAMPGPDGEGGVGPRSYRLRSYIVTAPSAAVLASATMLIGETTAITLGMPKLADDGRVRDLGVMAIFG